MYRVIEKFKDLCDGGYLYNVGDEYPRGKATKKRIAELSGHQNKAGRPLIEEVKEIFEEAIEGEAEETSEEEE